MASILDQETIDVLKDALGDDFALLIDTFLQDAPLRVQELQQCLASGDVHSLEQPAHTLKGSSGNIGAMALSNACAELVECCRIGKVEHPQKLVAAIIAEFDKVKPLLKSAV